jgi:hypothetical protein
MIHQVNRLFEQFYPVGFAWSDQLYFQLMQILLYSLLAHSALVQLGKNLEELLLKVFRAMVWINSFESKGEGGDLSFVQARESNIFGDAGLDKVLVSESISFFQEKIGD